MKELSHMKELSQIRKGPITYQRGMSQRNESHVNESCHPRTAPKEADQLEGQSHMNESREMCMGRVTCEYVTSKINESWHT